MTSRSIETGRGVRDTSRMICEMANSPTMTSTTPKPPVRLTCPKVSRAAPSMGEKPTMLIAIPKAAAISPLTTLSLESVITSSMAMIVSTVIS
ncbi:hypothetical protein D3C72_2309580 [compost metagenome]